MSNNFRAFEFGIRIATGFASDPVTGKFGEIYINTVSSTPKFYNGTVWIDMLRTESDDSVFRVYDNIDPTKKIALEASAIATTTTRTIIMPDNDVSLGNMVSKAASSTDNAIVRFDGITGALIQNSGILIDDIDNITGAASITISSALLTTGLSVTRTGISGAGGQIFLTGIGNPDNVLELSTTGGGNHISTANSALILTENLRIQSGNQTGVGGAASSSGGITLNTGNSTESISGNVGITTGDALSALGYSGTLSIKTGFAGSFTGAIDIQTGGSGSGPSGSVNMTSGQSLLSNSGDVSVTTGFSNASSGALLLLTGSGLYSGSAGLMSGPAGLTSGAVSVITGNGTGTASTSGALYLRTGSVLPGDGGNTGPITMSTGNTDGTASNSGNIEISTGNATSATSGNSGDIRIGCGEATFTNGGSITLIAGNSSSGAGGSVIINSGNSGAIQGDVSIGSSGAISLNSTELLNITSSNSSVFISSNETLLLGSTNNLVAISAMNSDVTLSALGFIEINSGSGVRRSSNGSTYIEELYQDSTTLLASQTNTTASEFTFAFATYEGLVIDYKIKENISNNVRIGTLYVATNGLTAQITDSFVETASVGVTWIATIVGSNVELQYTSGANAKIMRADIKKIRT